MSTDPQAIRDQVDAVLADLPRIEPDPAAGAGPMPTEGDLDTQAADIETIGRRLEEAHQILVDALESVEKG